MQRMTIRPSAKMITLSYVVIILIVIACVGLYYALFPEQSPLWLIAPALLLILPLRATIIRHLGARITLDDDRLIYEAGVMTKTTRTLDLKKVQDVRVTQRFGQRIIQTGDINVENAGETGTLLLQNVDNPQKIAHIILDAARHDPGIPVPPPVL